MDEAGSAAPLSSLCQRLRDSLAILGRVTTNSRCFRFSVYFSVPTEAQLAQLAQRGRSRAWIQAPPIILGLARRRNADVNIEGLVHVW